MTQNTRLSKLSPIVFAVALFPLLGGCAFTARGVIRPPRIAIVAHVPPPPTGRIVVRAGGSSRVGTVRTTPPPAPSVSESTIDISAAAPAITVEAGSNGEVWDGITLGEALAPVTVAYAPPPPPSTTVATIPAPRRGFIWVSGHQFWAGSYWTWRPARWARELPGHVYIAPNYDSNRRVWIQGHWAEAATDDTTTLNTRPRPPRPQDLLPAPRPTLETNYEAPRPTTSFDAHVEAELNARVTASAGIR